MPIIFRFLFVFDTFQKPFVYKYFSRHRISIMNILIDIHLVKYILAKSEMIMKYERMSLWMLQKNCPVTHVACIHV